MVKLLWKASAIIWNYWAISKYFYTVFSVIIQQQDKQFDWPIWMKFPGYIVSDLCGHMQQVSWWLAPVVVKLENKPFSSSMFLQTA